MECKMGFKGRFDFECRNKDGTLAWKKSIPNGTTTAGLNSNLNVYFGAGTQITTWYLGLIDNSGFSEVASGDTASSHGGWNESTAYSESVRQTWSPGAASGGVITNGTAASFTMNATATIKGAFLISNSTKGGTTGTLWATGLFDTAQTLSSGQVLKVTYTCTTTGA